MRVKHNGCIIGFDDSDLSKHQKFDAELIIYDFLDLITSVPMPGFYMELGSLRSEGKRNGKEKNRSQEKNRQQEKANTPKSIS